MPSNRQSFDDEDVCEAHGANVCEPCAFDRGAASRDAEIERLAKEAARRLDELNAVAVQLTRTQGEAAKLSKRVEWLEAALQDAATSLASIADRRRVEDDQVRLFAASRSGVAAAALGCSDG